MLLAVSEADQHGSEYKDEHADKLCPLVHLEIFDNKPWDQSYREIYKAIQS